MIILRVTLKNILRREAEDQEEVAVNHYKETEVEGRYIQVSRYEAASGDEDLVCYSLSWSGISCTVQELHNQKRSRKTLC